MLLITHDLRMSVSADRVLVLHGGRLVGDGAHADLLQRCDPYRALWAAVGEEH